MFWAFLMLVVTVVIGGFTWLVADERGGPSIGLVLSLLISAFLTAALFIRAW